MENFRNLEAKSLERMEKLLVSVSILDESLKLYEENLDKTMKAVTEKLTPTIGDTMLLKFTVNIMRFKRNCRSLSSIQY